MMEQFFQAALPPLEITPLPFVLGASLGLGVSLLATYIPAVRASRVTPLEGMRPVTQEDLEGVSIWFTLTGVVLLVIASALTYAFFQGWWLKIVPIVAAVIALAGFVMLIPAVLEPLSRFARFFLQPILRIEGDLAQRQLLRRRVRTTLTCGVLFVAISAGIALGTAIVNSVDDVGHWFERTVLGDFFIRATMPDMATGLSAEVPESIADEIRQVPGVVGLNSARIVSVQVDPAPTNESQDPMGAILIVRDFDSDERLELDLRDGDPEAVRKELFDGGVVIGTVLAKRTGLKMGDTIELARDGQKYPLVICGTANEYYVGGLALYMQRQVAKEKLGIDGVDGYAIKCDKQLDRAGLFRVETTLKEIAEQHGLMLQSHASLRAIVDGMVNGITGGLWVLLALGFVVAAFGIVNTLTMNVLEQTRELGLLRIVAMTRRQVRKMILSQAVYMGFIGLVPGALVGAGIAYLVSRSSEGEFGRSISFTLHPMMFFGALVVSYAIVVIAAWIPAQRAARLELRDALRYE
jgi:putative ABC transport system permease protein